MPYFLTDSSNVYRTLQEMEEKGLVSTKWEIAEDDTPRSGIQSLRQVVMNLNHFMMTLKNVMLTYPSF
jgi:hypothetical protein